MNDENTVKMILKFRGLKESLDYEGNIVVDEVIKDYVWENYDPNEFLSSVIKYGDIDTVQTPIRDRDPVSFFKHMFEPDSGWNEYDMLERYTLIESVPFNGMKFLVYDGQEFVMKWISEDDESRKDSK